MPVLQSIHPLSFPSVFACKKFRHPANMKGAKKIFNLCHLPKLVQVVRRAFLQMLVYPPQDQICMNNSSLTLQPFVLRDGCRIRQRFNAAPRTGQIMQKCSSYYIGWLQQALNCNALVGIGFVMALMSGNNSQTKNLSALLRFQDKLQIRNCSLFNFDFNLSFFF